MRRFRAGIVGVAFVFGILLFQSIERWTVIEHFVDRLKELGPGSAMFVKVLNSPLLTLAIAIAAVGLILKGRQEMRAEKKLPSPVGNSATQTQSTGPVTQQVFVGRVSEPPPPPREPEQPKANPNIRCLGPTITRIRVGLEGHGFYEDRDENYPYAAMVCFRNESSTDKKVVAVFNARASISFFDDLEQEMGTGVSEACWLDF